MRLQVISSVLYLILLILITSPSKGMAEISEISAPEVKKMLDEKSAVVINSLSIIDHTIQHIPGSINIAFELMKELMHKLPKDKNTPLVFYCMGFV